MAFKLKNALYEKGAETLKGNNNQEFVFCKDQDHAKRLLEKQYENGLITVTLPDGWSFSDDGKIVVAKAEKSK